MDAIAEVRALDPHEEKIDAHEVRSPVEEQRERAHPAGRCDAISPPRSVVRTLSTSPERGWSRVFTEE
ncbi:hypothetical protein CJU94_22045 [Paraburkholderia aromaticivorans]|uniref:Uncharacterized protein n=1 Tax=Paraburkholderia aromaticivorans TaxID=2026199 RepID=A0A248VQW0_9BURK|nr:hypothetical protein CJU94_22045 [Paraburkholderia aromaticivorans]